MRSAIPGRAYVSLISVNFAGVEAIALYREVSCRPIGPESKPPPGPEREHRQVYLILLHSADWDGSPENALIVQCGVDHSLDSDALLLRQVKDEVALEATHTPHPDSGELGLRTLRGAPINGACARSRKVSVAALRNRRATSMPALSI
jgi:hypothetical protein